MANDPVEARTEVARRLASADSLRAADEIGGAIAELRRVLENEESLSTSQAAEVRIRLADCTHDANDHEASYAALGPLLDNPPDSIWRARALVRFGRVLFFRGDAEATQAACFEAAQILNPTSHHADLALAQLWAGQAHEALGETAPARDALHAGLVGARRAGSRRLEAACLGRLAHLAMREADLPAAQRLLEQALKLDLAAGNRVGAASGRWHLAGCLRKRGRFDEAQSVLDAARTGYEELHDAGGLALVEILDAHLAQARGEDPAVHLDRAEGHARGAGDLRATHHVVLEQGFLAIANREYDRAATAFRSVLAAVETEGTALRNDARRGLATALARRGDREEARVLAEEARSEAARARDLLSECTAELLLAEIEHSLPRAKTVLERLLGTDVLATVAEAHRLVAALSEGGEREYHAREAARVEAGLGLAPPVESPAPKAPIAVSPEMKDVLAEAARLAGFEGTVVVEGEASVGKCRVAAVIHGTSDRSTQPLVTVECRGVPEETLVRRVFGDATAPGAFEEAGAGTVLLCDIDCAPSSFVIRLGHAVRFKELRRPDGTAVGHAARVLCTSSTPLHSHVRSGRLDPAAYTDIAQATLSVPPLRRRPEDLKALAGHYAGTKLSARVLKALARYDWPGNIEELKNTIHAAQYKAGGQPLALESLPDHLQGSEPTRESLPDRIAALERQEIASALHRTGGNKRAAAEILGVSRKGLIDRLKRLGLWEEYRRG